MRVEFIELLRCPAPHAASPLITVANERRGDDIIDAALGCVMCGADYDLHDGCVIFPPRDGEVVAVGSTSDRDTSPSEPIADLNDNALRLAALLGLADASARAMLCGVLAHVAPRIEELTGARCVAVNSHVASGDERAMDRLTMPLTDRVPLGDASLHGLAVDHAHRSLLADATRVVMRGGRIVAPASVPVPDGCRELARDTQQWVAEVVATASAPVTLQRAAGMRTDTHPR